MTRRDFVWTAAAAASAASPALEALIVPVPRVLDQREKCTPEQLRRFTWDIWPEAVRDFNRCGIQFQTSEATGEIRRTAADRPVFTGLVHGAVNMVLTGHIPMYWDNGRALAGVTTVYEGYHLCVIALAYAHGHQVPFVSLNTCLHELLHALLQDIYVSRPGWFQTGGRELRIDSYATGLWLFHEGDTIRKSAQAYVDRLRSDVDGNAVPPSAPAESK